MMTERNHSAADTAAEWVAKLSSQDVTDGDRAEFQEWLASSPENRRAFEDAHQTWLDLDALSNLANSKPDALPCELRLEIDRAAQLAENRWPDGDRGSKLRWFTAVAAALLVGVLATLWMVRFGSDPTDRGPRTVTYRTGVGERSEILLADGSLLTLNTDTVAHAALTVTRRTVHLERGEAYFTVVKDPDRPFVVTAGGGIVQAVGTEFNVYHRNDTTTITVLEGAVDVIPPIADTTSTGSIDPSLPDKRHRIERSQAFVVRDGGSEVIDLGLEMAARAASWRSGRLFFDGATLGEMVEEIDHYLEAHLVIADDEIASFTGGGVIHVDNVDSILLAIEKAWPVSVIHESPEVIVLRRRD